jgi:hypothetical protein
LEAKRTAKLPEGVGKKIVDALKKQNNVDIDELKDEDESSYWSSENSKTEEHTENSSSVQDDYQEKHFEEAENFETYEYLEEKDNDFIQEEDFVSNKVSALSFRESTPKRDSSLESSKTRSKYSISPKEPVNTTKNETNITYSANVSVLMKLISQLPSGVTRQTGAQIIRKTMEAMGISMNKVLGEAQQVQEELSRNIKNDMNTIEEYRNNIRILEKEVQKYKTQSDELEDLISLFILSDKDSP